MAKLLDLSVYGPGHISNILQVDASVYAKAFVTDGSKDTHVVRGDGTLASISSLSVGNADKVDGYHATCGNNNPWGTIPVITTGGYMDVGKHFEFHFDNTTGSDYSTALMCTGNYSNIVNLPSASGTLALTSQIPTVTNYYWANINITSSPDSTKIPTLGGLYTTGVIQSSSSYPVYFTSIGTDVYNKTVIMHSADGLIIERARKTESSSDVIIPLIISQRGGGNAVTFKNNDVLVSGRVESTENYVWESGAKYRVTTYGYQGIGRIYNYNEETTKYGDLYLGYNGVNGITIKGDTLNVGIGIGSPNYKLHVHGAIFGNYYNASGNSSGAALLVNKGSDVFGFGPSSSSVSVFSLGTVSSGSTWKKEMLYFTDDGRIGVNIYNPSVGFHINTSALVDSLLYFKNTSKAVIKYGTHTSSPLKGIALPNLNTPGVGIFARASESTDEGGIVITEDTCLIYNSFDNGWGLMLHDKDLNQTDISGDATRVFGINSNYQTYSKNGFVRGDSSDSYVLLGGGGHKAESSLSVNYANSAGSVAWDNVSGKPSSFTPSSHNHTKILYIDDRDTIETPSDVAGKNGIEIHFKNKSKSSIPSSGTWTAIVMFDGYSDTSGGYPMELGFSMSDISESRPLYLRTPKSSSEWGGWRMILDSNTYTDYTVKKDGTGASGTWGISITGNAAYATKLQTSRKLWSQSFDGTADVNGQIDIIINKQNSSTVVPASSAIMLGSNGAGHTGYHAGIAFNALRYNPYVNHIHAWIGLGPYTTTADAECYPLVFSTNGSTTTGDAPTERMRITPSGDVGIGDSNPAYKLEVAGSICGKVIYANRDASTTEGGVSLYSNADPMTYGIAFRGTGTYGTHGYVTSSNDWATYLTMNDSTTRGWIFRRGSTNVASIAGNGNMAIGQHLEFSNNAHISTNRSNDYQYGYTFNLGDNTKSIGMYSGPAGEAGGVVISPDGCLIYNSSDCGYNLQVRDKDLGGDLTNIATLTFGIEQDGHYAWSRGGFKKNGSSDSYILLGGGGHKAISDFATSGHTHTKSQITDFPTSLPASDVYDWAKQSTKPSYSFSEITPGVATIGDGTNRLMFRTNASYASGMYYSTPANESMVFANKLSVASWIFANTDPTTNPDWRNLTPSLQIKNGRVTINKLIADNTNAAYNLDVNGSTNATTLYENGVRVSVSGHTHSYLPLGGGWMDTDSQIYFKGAGSSTSVYGTLGFRSTTPNGFTMHYTNAQSKALFLCVNGYDAATDNGGLAIDNDGVTVFGAGDAGSVFRVINEDNVSDGAQFYVTKSSGVFAKYSITASSFYESSDERLKDFYNSIDVDLDKLSSLPKKFFKWKSNPNGEFEIGTSAQELQKIYPQLVNTDDNGYLTVAYDKLSIISLSAIDKLHLENKDLKREINILKQEIEKLKGQI